MLVASNNNKKQQHPITLGAQSGGSQRHRREKEKTNAVADQMASVRVRVVDVTTMTIWLRCQLLHRPTKPLINALATSSKLNLAFAQLATSQIRSG